MFKGFLYKNYCFFHSYRQWRRRRFTAAGLVVMTAVVVAAILGLDTKQNLIYQLFTLLVPLLLVSMLWSLFFRARFAVVRELPKFATVDQPFTYHLDIQNLSSKVQKGLFVCDNPDNPRPSLEDLMAAREPGEEQRNIWDRKILYHRWLWLIRMHQRALIKEQPVPSLAPNEKGRIAAEIQPRRRGYLNLKSVTIARPDPFGLFRSILTIESRQRVLVLPKRYRLPSIDLPGIRKHHAGGVALASSVGNSDEFVSMREYRPGDPIKQIHWKSSAKADELIIKEFQDEFFVRHALILDTFHKEPHSNVFEEAVSMAASFVSGLNHQETLLDLMFMGARAYCFASGRGLSHTDRIMEILACVTPCRDQSFSALLPMVVRYAQRLSGCICILLAWDAERKTLVRHLKTLGVPAKVMVILDNADDGLIDPGPMKDDLNNFHILEAGRIQEGLAAL